MSNAQQFRVALSKEALKYYSKAGTAIARRLDRCFASLESEPTRGRNIRPLRETPDRYRYRVGDLRIVYDVDLSLRIVYVLAILPRGQVYKN